MCARRAVFHCATTTHGRDCFACARDFFPADRWLRVSPGQHTSVSWHKIINSVLACERMCVCLYRNRDGANIPGDVDKAATDSFGCTLIRVNFGALIVSVLCAMAIDGNQFSVLRLRFIKTHTHTPVLSITSHRATPMQHNYRSVSCRCR